MPRYGWMNDPNGPIYYAGRYHLFYQHVVNSCEWSFGLVWGHAVSTDLVHWEHLPPALMPTEGSGDADGCFSGCTVIDANGRPTILYTGVRLRSNPDCGALPPVEQDLQLPFIEMQCSAVPMEGDDLLRVWTKNSTPMIELPPADLPLVGWRDPFIFETGGNGREWGMLIGTGLKGQGGAAMIYRSKDLHSGWRYDGLLCEADNADTGVMWECPILLQLNRQPEVRLKFRGLHAWNATDSLTLASLSANPNDSLLDGMLPTTDSVMANPKSMLSLDLEAAAAEGEPESRYTHFFCVSPDAPTNPVLYWVGGYDQSASRFQLEGAKGPFRMDLGDIMYAPNMMTDDKGRHLFWGWLQERRRVGTYDYSGCLSLPRLIYLRGDNLVQEPAPEVTRLRCGESWHAADLMIYPEEGTPVQAVGGQALELEVTLLRGESTAAGVHFCSWRADSEHAAVLVDWERSILEVVFTDGAPVDLVTLAELDPEVDGLRRVGGPIDLKAGEGLTLRLFVDHSCVEVYSSTGEVLSTRVYRGAAPRAAEAGIQLVSYGGPALVHSVRAWEMGTIWKEDLQAQPLGTSLPSASPLAQHPMLLREMESVALSSLDSSSEHGSEVEDYATSSVDGMPDMAGLILEDIAVSSY